MKLIGKRIERLNQFGDNLVIKLGDEGTMRLSPALMSRLKIDAAHNKIGFGYPESNEESLVVYNATDGDGVAVNKQGYIKNLPHSRDIRSYLELPGTGDTEVYVAEANLTFDEYPGMAFYKVIKTAETVEETTDHEWEEKNEEVPVAYIKEHPPGEVTEESGDDYPNSTEALATKLNEQQQEKDEEDAIDIWG